MARNVEANEARIITREIEAAAAAIFEAHGLTPKPASTTYGDEYRVRLVAIATVVDERGVNKADPSVDAWDRYARHIGLPTEALGKEFTYGGKSYRVTGLNPRLRVKNPVQAVQVATGKAYVFPVDAVKAFLAAAGMVR